METRRMFRSKSDRMIAGVCGGLGKYFNVDVMLVRLVFLLLLILGGSGFLLYLVLAVIMPEEGTTAGTPQAVMQENTQQLADRARTLGQSLGAEGGAAPDGAPAGRQGAMIFGAILVLLGAAFLLQNLLRINFSQFWPLILIAIGVVMLLPMFRRPQA